MIPHNLLFTTQNSTSYFTELSQNIQNYIRHKSNTIKGNNIPARKTVTKPGTTHCIYHFDVTAITRKQSVIRSFGDCVATPRQHNRSQRLDAGGEMMNDIRASKATHFD